MLIFLLLSFSFVGSINVQVQQNDNQVIKHPEQDLFLQDEHV